MHRCCHRCTPLLHPGEIPTGCGDKPENVTRHGRKQCLLTWPERSSSSSVLAQAVPGDMAGGTDMQMMQYGQMITALNDQFAPSNQMKVNSVQVCERKQRAAESLPELSQHIGRLTNLI